MADETACGYHWVMQLLSQQKEAELESCLNSILVELVGEQRDFRLYIDKSFSSFENIELTLGTPLSIPDTWLVKGEELSVIQVCQFLSGLNANLNAYLTPHSELLVVKHSTHLVGFLCLISSVTQQDLKPLSTVQRDTLHHLLSVYIKQLFTLQQARIDPLSQLLNRQTFEEKVGTVLQGDEPVKTRAKLTNRKWYLALMDIDFFKRVNDTFGHVIGDEVIVLVAQLLKEQFRGEDYIFRYGGEEFAVLFPSQDDEHAIKAVERVRSKVEQTRFPQVEQVTISIGLVEAEGAPQVAELVNKADMALYHSKETGRNRVTAYSELGIEDNGPGHCDIELF